MHRRQTLGLHASSNHSKGQDSMIPTPTPIILSGPASNGDLPFSVWLIFALAIGLQVLKFYRRRQLVLKQREAKNQGSTTAK